MVKIKLMIDDDIVYEQEVDAKKMNINNTRPIGPPMEVENVPMNMGGGRKKMKKAKGTRKLSPYMKFAQEARPKVLKEHPEMKSDIIGVGRKIGEMWRGLSDAEKARY